MNLPPLLDQFCGKKRKTHSPQFKAKVALAAIQNDETTSQIASRFGVHPTMVSTWKRQMLEGAAGSPQPLGQAPPAMRGKHEGWRLPG